MHDWQGVVHMDGGDFVIPELGKEITQDEITALGIWREKTHVVCSA
jgi:hypothetical protein